MMRSRIWFTVLALFASAAAQFAGIMLAFGDGFALVAALASAAAAALGFWLAACALRPKGELLAPIALDRGELYVLEFSEPMTQEEVMAVEQRMGLEAERLGVRFVVLPHFLHLALQARTKGPAA